MSQRDVVAELRSTRLEAPEELRERVRLVAATAPPEGRSFFDRRRMVALFVPIAAVVAVAVVVTRPSHNTAAPTPLTLTTPQGAIGSAPGAEEKRASVATDGSTHLATVTPSTTRVQKYSASLTLRVRNAGAVSQVTKRAVSAITALGGYVVSAHVNADGATGNADLVLRVPKTKVRTAISRLSALGTITDEQVDIQDLQATVNASNRTMERLQRQLKDLRAQTQTPEVTRQIAALTTRIERLQRTEAAALRAARYATVQLHVATPAPVTPTHHGHGPLHGLGVAFRWIGIGAVYGLALGLPALALLGLGWLAVRTIRRRRELHLLNL